MKMVLKLVSSAIRDWRGLPEYHRMKICLSSGEINRVRRKYLMLHQALKSSYLVSKLGFFQ